VWYHLQKKGDIRCNVCITQKQCCSFTKLEKGIDRWPRVTKKSDVTGAAPSKGRESEEVLEDKSEEIMGDESAADKEELQSSIQVQAPSVSTGNQPTTEVTAATITTVIPMAAVPVPPKSTVGLTQGIQGTPSIILYPDVVAFDARVSDPSLSLVAMQTYRTEARAVMLREMNEAELIVARMKDRRAIWDGIIEKLDRRIKRTGKIVHGWSVNEGEK
jgi:hypothetical protein